MNVCVILQRILDQKNFCSDGRVQAEYLRAFKPLYPAKKPPPRTVKALKKYGRIPLMLMHVVLPWIEVVWQFA